MAAVQSVTLQGMGDTSVPLSPYVVGSQVGVPAGASLTASIGLGTDDGTSSIVLVHPVTKSRTTRTVTRYFYRRRWTATINPVVPSGETWVFDECEFDVASDFFCVDVADVNGTSDIMQPLIVFRRCTFDGNDTTGKNIVGGFFWVDRCHLSNASDGVAGMYYTVINMTNIVCTTNGGPDPHSDATQCAGIGRSVLYRSWLDAGRESAAANAPVRVGVEFSPVVDYSVYYCGLAGTQHGMQMRGDSSPDNGTISGVKVVGCRWVNEQVYGPTDFFDTTIDLWSDNTFMNGTTISNPAP